MKLKIICWNVRGVNKADKRELVKLVLCKWKADTLHRNKNEKDKFRLYQTTWVVLVD